MFSSRAMQQSLRRLAAPQASRAALTKFVAPTAIAGSNTAFVQRRQATQHVPESSAQTLLAQQRQNRPVSPHLGIYRPQITWYGSMLNRITGLALSGPLYLFAAAYLVAPAVGWHLESASIAAAFAAWPVALKVATKMLVAWPFAFHSLNGIRHLVWDLGLQISNKQVVRTGWSVVGLSVVGALALAFV